MAYEVQPEKPPFVDREDEQERGFHAIDGWGEEFRSLCLSVTGVAGIGKTALAHRIVRERLVRFPDDVLSLDLDEYRDEAKALDLRGVLTSLLLKLGAAPEWSGHSLTDLRHQYQTKMEGRRTATIVDNARFSSEVEPLLAASGTSVMLVTSHSRLVGLEAGAAVEIPLAPLSEKDALDLLLDVSGDRRLAADDEAATELVRLCDGLPLAIRVAASFIRGHRHQSLPALLDAFRRKLREEGLDEVERIWDVAYESLGSDAARLYRLLASAPGTAFTKYSAAALLGCGPDSAAAALEELEDAALADTVPVDTVLVNTGAVGRTRLHGVVRAHAQRRAQRHGDAEELAEAQRRIVRWYLRQAQLADEAAAGSRLTLAPRVPPLPGVDDAPTGDGHQWLEAERHALRDCVVLAYERGLDTEAWSLCEPLFTLYQDHPNDADTLGSFGIGLEAAQREEHVAAVVRMRSQLAFVHRARGSLDEAEREITRALATSGALGSSDDDRKLMASAVEIRGRVRGDQGEWESAAADFTRALDAHVSIGNDYGAALARYRLGEALVRLGEPERAAELLERAHGEMRRLGRERMTARTGFALAGVLRGLGQPDRARELYEESLDSARRRHSDFDEARVLDALAELADETGNSVAAGEHRAAADAIRKRNGISS